MQTIENTLEKTATPEQIATPPNPEEGRREAYNFLTTWAYLLAGRRFIAFSKT